MSSIHEISKAQALALCGSRPKLLPRKGETINQLGDSSGRYKIGQTTDGKFFTEDSEASKLPNFDDMPSIAERAKQQYAGWKGKP